LLGYGSPKTETVGFLKQVLGLINQVFTGCMSVLLPNLHVQCQSV